MPLQREGEVSRPPQTGLNGRMSVLIAVLGSGVLVGMAVICWDSLGLGAVATLDQYERYLRFTPHYLRHVPRLWQQGDFCYLRDLAAGRHLEAPLRRDRRRVRRLVLKDIRCQFRAAIAVATMLATLPSARQLNFGIEVLLWISRFNVAFVGLFLSSLPLLDRVQNVSPAGLLEVLERAHKATRALMVALTANDMADLEDLILTE